MSHSLKLLSSSWNVFFIFPQVKKSLPVSATRSVLLSGPFWLFFPPIFCLQFPVLLSVVSVCYVSVHLKVSAHVLSHFLVITLPLSQCLLIACVASFQKTSLAPRTTLVRFLLLLICLHVLFTQNTCFSLPFMLICVTIWLIYFLSTSLCTQWVQSRKNSGFLCFAYIFTSSTC